jgi:endonuclease/exonuclease/phosphatase (EEP) superfamily protein YafD
MPSHPTPPRDHRAGSRSRRRGAALAALALGTLLAGLPVAQPAVAASSSSEVTLVQANIKSDLSVARFQADVAEVLSGGPDFVTYNEVPLRNDAVLAPSGYALHRSDRNRYTRATPVAWRTDRWTMVDSGTFKISGYRQKPPGRKVRIGLRFANWVTLQSFEGRQVSVVSMHVAPLDKNMPDLLRGSVRRLGQLTEQLAPAGPVLVGGDFNVHYTSGRYPRDLFDAAQLVPTYDSMGGHFPTGDHGGHTIDYVFQRGAGQLGVEQHRGVELHSDHDAVVAGSGWLVDAPQQSFREVSRPHGDATERRLAVRSVVKALRGTTAGERVDLVTGEFGLRPFTRAVRRAIGRGVHVRLIARGPGWTRGERRVARIAERSGDRASGVTRCTRRCFQAWKDSEMRRSFVLVRNTGGNPTLRLDVTRDLTKVLLQRRTAVTTHIGEVALEEGQEMLASLR